ncbi:host cell division inhibitor Icd-like protein [Salmonella enterica]|nr:host cell division inhibitor Icd-like protein [Salmonella enterica]
MILHNSIMDAQNLSRRNSHAQIKLGDMPSLNSCVRLASGHRDKGEQYSGSPEHQHCLSSEVPTNNVVSCEDNQPSLRGAVQRLCGSLRPSQNLQVTKSHQQNNPEIIGAVHSITESNPVQLSDSDLAFLRWRRLISPRIAVTINPALLSPSSLSDSISATTSCGTRTVKSCDFAFLLDVAITDSFDVWCVSVYAKKSYAQCLKCVSLECSFKSEGETHLTNSEARQCSNTNRASYHNVTEAYIMACIQHTQTRPKYQYRFLALSAIGRNVIHITATTEREAREQSPAGCVMVFAGRLPVEVRHA